VDETVPPDETMPAEWIEEFEAAARRPLRERLRWAFVRTYKPVLDDAPYRSFETMADYRRWCEESLPSWLGHGRAAGLPDGEGRGGDDAEGKG
jgi:hypothetical protein